MILVGEESRFGVEVAMTTCGSRGHPQLGRFGNKAHNDKQKTDRLGRVSDGVGGPTEPSGSRARSDEVRMACGVMSCNLTCRYLRSQGVHVNVTRTCFDVLAGGV